MKGYPEKFNNFLNQGRNFYAAHKGKFKQLVGEDLLHNQQHDNPPPTLQPAAQFIQDFINAANGKFNHQHGVPQHSAHTTHQQVHPHCASTSDNQSTPNLSHPQQVPNAAQLGPQRPHVSNTSTPLPPHIIEQIPTRIHSARVKLRDLAIQDACKGLSRVLRPGDEADIQHFGSQLVNMDQGAIAMDYHTCLTDGIPCFAVSYVQSQTFQGRFKFSPTEWENFHIALRGIAGSGIRECRVWLDQCLWLRDASQGSWAHTGIVPYVLWPVISLGVKVVGEDRTTGTYERMWPFVEEVAGLWSLGVIVSSEMRGRKASEGARRWLSFNHRVQLEPEESMGVLLLNIYHGAADGLATGWKEDVKELQEMARWNVNCYSEGVIVGADWRVRAARLDKREFYAIREQLQLPKEYWIGDTNLGGRGNIYLDGSRKIARGSWNGLEEWLSGNEAGVSLTDSDYRVCVLGVSMYNILTDKGEFQMLGSGSAWATVWMLVAMDGRTSGIRRGRVAWTKVMSGKMTCFLPGNFYSGDTRIIHEALQEQLGVDVRIISVREVEAEVEWV